MNTANVSQAFETLDAVDKSLINQFQDGFPLETEPYKAIALQLELSESEVIERLTRLQADNVISRIGAIVQPNTIGVSTLCAVAVPKARVGEVATLINSYSEVNHNYQRTHYFNLWFVVTAADEMHLSSTIDKISKQTALQVLNLPLETAYYLNLGFDID